MCLKSSARNDIYVSLKIIKLCSNQTISLLKTKTGALIHVYNMFKDGKIGEDGTQLMNKTTISLEHQIN